MLPPSQGTPDEVRTRRYRQVRDVGAAARLDIGGLDDDLEVTAGHTIMVARWL